MATSPISRLPPEVLHQILNYLPIAFLLRFGLTSKYNYSAAILALKTLRLAIFSRRLHGMLAFLSSATFKDLGPPSGDLAYDHPCRNEIIVTSSAPPSTQQISRTRRCGASFDPALYRDQLFQSQNARACSILSTPTLANLSSLSLYMNEITSPNVPELLATLFPSLRELHLNFHHPFTRDPALPSQSGTNQPCLQPSPIWNALAGIGDQSSANLRLRKLEKLTVDRASINSFQLRKWVECNPYLQELRLRNVLGIDMEFVQWLGDYYDDNKLGPEMPKRVKLRVLVLERCSALVIKSVEDFSWLTPLLFLGGDGIPDESQPPALHTLSFRSSRLVSTASLCEYFETNRPALHQLTLPENHVLVPRRPKGPRKNSNLSVRSKRKKRTRTKPKDPTADEKSISQGPNINEPEPDATAKVDVPAPIADNNSSEDDSSEEEGGKSKTPPTVFVSYMRIQYRHNPGSEIGIMSSDIIEPDPDLI